MAVQFAMDILSNENDFSTSVLKALKETDANFYRYPGLVIVGSHTPIDVEYKLQKIKEARFNNIPTLGICMGMQLMAIEYARNACGLLDANSTEIDPQTSAPVVVKLEDLRVGIKEVSGRQESHWHNYKFNEDYEKFFQGWQFVYSEGIVEVMQLKQHPFFLGTQFHPEYASTLENPHPIIKEFLAKCSNQ